METLRWSRAEQHFLLSFAHPRLALALDEQQFEAMTLGHDELVAVSQPLPSSKPRHALPGTAAKRDLHLHLHAVTESDFAESLQEQALQGAGVAWLPLALVAADLKAGRLVMAGAPAEPIRYEIRLYRPRKLHLQKIWAASR